MFFARCLALLAVIAVPAVASAESPHATAAGTKLTRTARVQKSEPRACLKPTVEVTAGTDSATFSLSRCDGTPAPRAVDQLSILARPSSAAKPKETLDVLSKRMGPDVSPGIRRVDARLLGRLEQVVTHFRRPGDGVKVQLISGVRPKSAGSYHQVGRALDFRIEGVTNEALVAFCKTLPDTGCGYYPNSLFVHMDVRERGAGHVAWIDVSRPGEPPKYVSQWPLPKKSPASEEAASTAAGSLVLPALPTDEESNGPPARARRSGRAYFF